ncbi:hypothetical protein KAR02_05790 [Candidatus Bipolaricaulota bacterium]|nr:hypothetical protein [Candidatus Bipolaricaulota bacterium]
MSAIASICSGSVRIFSSSANVVKAFLGLAILVSLIGCNHTVQKLAVANAENAGFDRDQQQFYQIVGAEDGWSGTWGNTEVELYQYANEESAQQAVQMFTIEDLVQPGNISSWVTFCQVNNLLMLSTGMEPCRQLRGLGSR